MTLWVTLLSAQADESGLFPDAVRGWRLAASSENYTREDLHRYIDGAAELYFSYGFRKLLTRRYEKAGQPEIVVDLFDMDDPGNAFGIFAHSQEHPGLAIGQDGEYLDGLLRFWQGRYYVSLLGSPENPELRLALMDLGRKLAERLAPAAARPALLALLPEPGLIASSIRYFRHPAWQNTYVFIAAENILEIGPDSEALLAKYEHGLGRPVVLWLRYPDPAAAGRALAALASRFGLPAGGGKAVLTADGKYFAAGMQGNAVAAVWHGGGKEALALLAAMLAKTNELK